MFVFRQIFIILQFSVFALFFRGGKGEGVFNFLGVFTEEKDLGGEPICMGMVLQVPSDFVTLNSFPTLCFHQNFPFKFSASLFPLG